MKFCTILGLLAFQGITVSAIPALREDQDTSLNLSPLETRAECWFGKSVGCSKSGFCWKTCPGSRAGTWCWLAWDGGNGDWLSCKGDPNAGQRYCERMAADTSQFKCGRGSCNACGCKCH